jgi:hypothetical protein
MFPFLMEEKDQIQGGKRRTRTIKSKCKEEEKDDPNPKKKKVIIHNPRNRHNIDGAICYGLHRKNYVQEK